MGVCSVEVTLIRQAHEMGFLTTPYAFNSQESHAMAMAGADIVVAHMGLTTAGSIGAKTAVSLEDSVRRVQSIADAAYEVNPEIIVLCHGGECFLSPTHLLGTHPTNIYCDFQKQGLDINLLHEKNSDIIFYPV